MDNRDEVEKLADLVANSWNEFRNWYLYEGGKESWIRKENEERLEALRLTETKEIVAAWKEHIKNLSFDYIALFEECIQLCLANEWGINSRVEFDYENQTVKCFGEGMEMTI